MAYSCDGIYFQLHRVVIDNSAISECVMNLSQLPYLFNIVVLLPIAVPIIFRSFPIDQGCFKESEGWRKLVGSMWTAILVLSIMGLFYPERFSPLLAMQVIYKSLWLVSYVAPRIRKKHYKEIPVGITSCFIFIVFTYPLIIPWRLLFT